MKTFGKKIIIVTNKNKKNKDYESVFFCKVSKNKTDLKILFEGDPKLFNQYGVVIINKNYCPNVNLQGAKKFVNWLISDDGQIAIETFKVNGERLFFRSH